MPRTFIIDKYPLDEGFKLYQSDKFTFDTGITVLVGCNGTGKTTLLRALQYQLKHLKETESIYYKYYDNDMESCSLGYNSLDDFRLFGALATSSEGEKINLNIAEFVNNLFKDSDKYEDSKEIWILIDSVDSGMSIDNLVYMKTFFHSAFINKYPGKDIYVVVSTNSYETARGENCMDVRTAKHIKFEDYEEYRKFILNSRKYKEKRNEDYDKYLKDNED